jgi:hypothetical protein
MAAIFFFLWGFFVGFPPLSHGDGSEVVACFLASRRHEGEDLYSKWHFLELSCASIALAACTFYFRACLEFGGPFALGCVFLCLLFSPINPTSLHGHCSCDLHLSFDFVRIWRSFCVLFPCVFLSPAPLFLTSCSSPLFCVADSDTAVATCTFSSTCFEFGGSSTWFRVVSSNSVEGEKGHGDESFVICFLASMEAKLSTQNGTFWSSPTHLSHLRHAPLFSGLSRIWRFFCAGCVFPLLFSPINPTSLHGHCSCGLHLSFGIVRIWRFFCVLPSAYSFPSPLFLTACFGLTQQLRPAPFFRHCSNLAVLLRVGPRIPFPSPLFLAAHFRLGHGSCDLHLFFNSFRIWRFFYVVSGCLLGGAGWGRSGVAVMDIALCGLLPATCGCCWCE